MKGTITWLLIEDAPKDGTRILASTTIMQTLFIVNWNSELQRFVSYPNSEYRFPMADLTHFAHINPPESTCDS